MVTKNLFQIIIVLRRHSIICIAYFIPILFIDCWIAAERIETDNFTRVIVGLVDSTERFKQCKVLAPAHSKFHNDAMNGKNPLIKLMQVQHSGKSLSVDE